MRLKVVAIVVVSAVVLSLFVFLASSTGADKDKDLKDLEITASTPQVNSVINPESATLALASDTLSPIDWEVRSCTLNDDGATLDLKVKNNGDNTENVRVTFDFSNNGRIEKNFDIAPKQNLVMDIPITGTDGDATVSIYVNEALTEQRDISVPCVNRGGSGSSGGGLLKADNSFPVVIQTIAASETSDSTTSDSSYGDLPADPAEIPEFPTIMLPLAFAAAIIFVVQRIKRN